MSENFSELVVLESAIKQFKYYQSLAEKTFDQLDEDQLRWKRDSEDNDIMTISKHIAGNMKSRWTNFLTEDGEKSWRQRDREFINDYYNREEMMQDWNEAWACLFEALKSIDEEKMHQIVYIRNMGHSVVEAIHRQLAHYAYHIGQIVMMGKMQKGNAWVSLSIPKRFFKRIQR